nr:hypothetical protein [Bradyrhizobium sp.]
MHKLFSHLLRAFDCEAVSEIDCQRVVGGLKRYHWPLSIWFRMRERLQTKCVRVIACCTFDCSRPANVYRRFGTAIVDVRE